MKTLQVGKSYKDGHGDSYIISLNEGLGKEHYPYKGTSLETGDQWVFTSQGFFTPRATGCDDLIIPDEPEQTTESTESTESTKEEPKVKHLEVILAIVQKIPVQFDYTHDGTWLNYMEQSDINPIDHHKYNWRITPAAPPKRTVQIGKRTVVAPEIEAPSTNKSYFYWDSSQGCVLDSYWYGTVEDYARLHTGNLFSSENDAENCYEAITDLLLGKD